MTRILGIDPLMNACGSRRGSNAGYQRHRLAGEQPCEECTVGRNAQRRAKWVPKPPRPDTREQRFWAKVGDFGFDECWPWQDYIDKNGYGQLGVGGRSGTMASAHRVAWELAHETAVPDGLQIDHACHTEALRRGECVGGVCMHRRCVNPLHLEAVTPQINSARSDCGRVNAARQLAITHCPQGHPYDAENTHVKKNGSRSCRACARAYGRRTYKPRKRVSA